MGLGLPNDFAEKFHPNEKGHVTMASFAMAEAMDLRSLVLGIDPPSCEVKDQFKCWNIEQPDHEKGWDYYKVYDEDTPDEHEFRISLSDDGADYDVNQCIDSFKKLIHNCDNNRRLNWKTGGKYVRDDGAYTYETVAAARVRPRNL
ncbi:hypothetical protein J7337_011267 [Fusarium musae]|uniref:Uncharacterized protein n=1 Tax=Fusarium musae TaxID=1042133 RepID=A0A9P8II29_9HYPO|nr:hypothetical protein J7337_011267 [Fusarium musae]KAG9496491.1 hypothetical protein J7337_011267 [Fusarium musae]